MTDEPSGDPRPPTGLFLVAAYREQPAGRVGVRFDPGYAELTRLFVAPAVRLRGEGVALLAAAEAHARSAGADRIRLDTRGDLVEALALYAGHGVLGPTVRRPLVRETAVTGVLPGRAGRWTHPVPPAAG